MAKAAANMKESQSLAAASGIAWRMAKAANISRNQLAKKNDSNQRAAKNGEMTAEKASKVWRKAKRNQ